MGKKPCDDEIEEPQQSKSLQQDSLKGDKYLKKKPWTDQQDNMIRKLVQKYGARRWSIIALNFPKRNGKQCRVRWHNHLNHCMYKFDWSHHQQWTLFLAHSAYGKKWEGMTKMLPGRTDNQIKNHWNWTMLKKHQNMQNIMTKLIEIKKLSFLSKTEVPEHYVKTQKQLLQYIYDNKDIIIKLSSQRNNVQVKPMHFSVERIFYDPFQ